MSDKKIRRYAWIALIVAIALGVWGEVSRVLARSELVKVRLKEVDQEADSVRVEKP